MEFFTWTNEPKCSLCNVATQCIGRVPPNEDQRRWGAGNVENYVCRQCNRNCTFPRYNHPQKLLGESLLCIASIANSRVPLVVVFTALYNVPVGNALRFTLLAFFMVSCCELHSMPGSHYRFRGPGLTGVMNPSHATHTLAIFTG